MLAIKRVAPVHKEQNHIAYKLGGGTLGKRKTMLGE